MRAAKEEELGPRPPPPAPCPGQGDGREVVVLVLWACRLAGEGVLGALGGLLRDPRGHGTTWMLLRHPGWQSQDSRNWGVSLQSSVWPGS